MSQPADDYDWRADATGSWGVAVAEAKRRAEAGEPQIPFFERGYRFPSDEYRRFLGIELKRSYYDQAVINLADAEGRAGGDLFAARA